MAELVLATENLVGEPFTDEQCVDKDWLNRYCGLDVASASLVPLTDAGGLNAEMKKLVVVLITGEEKTYVLKRNHGSARAIYLGTSREAFFYKYFASTVAEIVPKVNYAYGDMATGTKAILMENLSDCIQCGYFFGKHSPHNWSKDLQAIVGYEDSSPARISAMETVTESAFLAAAKLHATYWNDRSLLNYSWVRGGTWMKGEGRELWEAAQAQSSGPWAATKANIQSGASGVRWNPLVESLLDASYAKISWETYQESIQNTDFVFTLAHSDFHPANMMWRRNFQQPSQEGPEQGVTILLDWEVIGVGSGPQECAQYVISHMRPEERRNCELRLLRSYYQTLIAGSDGKIDSTNYPFERCLADYVAGGIGRWVWMLGLLSRLCPDNWVQYFHDQFLAFAEDHNVTVENVPMPRV